MEEQPPWVTGAHIEPTLEDLSIDDTLSQLDRVKRYVSANIPLQRLVHVKLFASTVAESSLEDITNVLLPLIPSIVQDEKFVVRQHLCDQLVRVSQHLVGKLGQAGYDLMLSHLIPPIGALVNDEKEEVRQAASEALVQIASLVDGQDLARHILTQVLQLAHDDEREELRSTGSYLLNELAPILGADLCRQFLIPEIVSLSEDPSVHVRKSSAWNMHHLCRISVQMEGASSRVLGAFDQLSQDDSQRVRRACAATLPEISKATNPEIRQTSMIEVYERLKDDTSLIRTDVLGNLGTFIATLEPNTVLL